MAGNPQRSIHDASERLPGIAAGGAVVGSIGMSVPLHRVTPGPEQVRVRPVPRGAAAMTRGLGGNPGHLEHAVR